VNGRLIHTCLICTRLLLASGISKIYYVHEYKKDNLVEIFANQKQVDIINIANNLK